MKVELFPLVASMSGSISKKSSYYIRYNKQTKQHFLCHKPKKTERTKEFNKSANAQTAKEKFKKATQYACAILKDPNQAAKYKPQWEKQMKHYSTFRGWLVNHYYEEYLNHGNSNIEGTV